MFHGKNAESLGGCELRGTHICKSDNMQIIKKLVKSFLLVSKLRLIELFNTPNTKSISTIFRVNIPVMDMLSVSLKPSLPPISQNTFGDGIQKVVDMGQIK